MRSKSIELKRRIYDYVNEYKRDYGKSPSLSTIGDKMRINKSTVYRYLVDMDRDGDLHYDGTDIETKEMNQRNTRLSCAAIVGSIPCGEAQIEESYVEDYVNLPESLFGRGDFYILHARGDSMEDAGIFEGDLVVILKTPVADKGDIVVALDDEGQNTLKRLDGYDKKGRAILEYMNEAVYPDKKIIVNELTVQGVAKYVIKAL